MQKLLTIFLLINICVKAQENSPLQKLTKSYSENAMLLLNSGYDFQRASNSSNTMFLTFENKDFLGVINGLKVTSKTEIRELNNKVYESCMEDLLLNYLPKRIDTFSSNNKEIFLKNIKLLSNCLEEKKINIDELKLFHNTLADCLNTEKDSIQKINSGLENPNSYTKMVNENAHLINMFMAKYSNTALEYTKAVYSDLFYAGSDIVFDKHKKGIETIIKEVSKNKYENVKLYFTNFEVFKARVNLLKDKKIATYVSNNIYKLPNGKWYYEQIFETESNSKKMFQTYTIKITIKEFSENQKFETFEVNVSALKHEKGRKGVALPPLPPPPSF